MGHQCFRTGGLFCFSGINYTTESIWGNGSIGISKGHHATPIGKRYISAPCIGNEYIMLSERSWCGVSPPLRSGKDSPTNGINNFFSEFSGYLRVILRCIPGGNIDIEGFCSWIAWGRWCFLPCIIIKFSGAEWHSLSSSLGPIWSPWHHLGMIAYKFQGFGIESLRGLFFGSWWYFIMLGYARVIRSIPGGTLASITGYNRGIHRE